MSLTLEIDRFVMMCGKQLASLFVFASVFASVFGSSAFAQDNIKIAVIADAPPYTVIDGNTDGMDILVLKEMASRAGLAISFHPVITQRLEMMVQLNKADGFTAIRKINGCHLTQAYSYWSDAIIVRANDANKYHSVSDFKGLETSTFNAGLTVLGDQLRPLVDNDSAPRPIGKVENAVRMLMAGRTQAHFGDMYVFRHVFNLMQQSGALEGHISKNAAPPYFRMVKELARSPQFLCMRDQWIAARFDAALSTMWEDGTIDRIHMQFLK